MGATLTLVSTPPQPIITTGINTAEKFELLIFDRYGSLYIQTNIGWYYFATAYWLAAKTLHSLLSGNSVTGVMSYPEHRILNPEQRQCCLCLDEDTIVRAHHVDRVESDWPGVMEFFRVYRERSVIRRI
jgi:hypothetical protein